MGCFLKIKNKRQKGLMDHFFTLKAEMVVQNQKNWKMNQTIINDTYKKKKREKKLISLLEDECMRLLFHLMQSLIQVFNQ